MHRLLCLFEDQLIRKERELLETKQQLQMSQRNCKLAEPFICDYFMNFIRTADLHPSVTPTASLPFNEQHTTDSTSDFPPPPSKIHSFGIKPTTTTNPSATLSHTTQTTKYTTLHSLPQRPTTITHNGSASGHKSQHSTTTTTSTTTSAPVADVGLYDVTPQVKLTADQCAGGGEVRTSGEIIADECMAEQKQIIGEHVDFDAGYLSESEQHFFCTQ
eukprot:GHVS01098913.1.p1 GENE.GHVS01098913.1~~GHVS01098913.1.p1  ORF type:complete len:217 (+),score=47.37 GHVS01098913.1:203-853(+)